MVVTHRTVHALDERGTIRDWLVAPAQGRPCDDLDDHLDAVGPPWGPPGSRARWVLTNGPDVAPLKARLYAAHPLPDAAPELAEGEAVRHHTGQDGLVDWSTFCFTPSYRRGVAQATLEVDQADPRVLEIASTGPWRAFLDGEPIAASEAFTYMEPHVTRVSVALPSRTSTLTVVTWQVGFREVRHVLRVRVVGLPVRVVVPSPGADEDAAARVEPLLAACGLARWGSDDGRLPLVGPPGTGLDVAIDGVTQRVVLGDGPTWVDLPAPPDAAAAGPTQLAGFGEVTVRAASDDPALLPVSRTWSFARLPAHRATPEPGADHRRELLEHAASLTGVGAALARWALGRPDPIAEEDLGHALGMIAARADCADFEAVGLLNLLHRVPDADWPAGTRDTVVAALGGLRYWIDQPGLDAMCFFTENHQVVWHTGEALAGELLGDDDRARHGRTLASEWVDARLAGGLAEFDSNAYLAIDLLALVSLAEFGTDADLASRARDLAERILRALAHTEFAGIHGAAQGRSYVQTLRSGRFEEAAGIMWACFGVGALNQAVLPAVVVATATQLDIPSRERPDHPTWSAHANHGRYRFEHDLLERPYASDLRVYRTPHVLLGSAQDYRSGLPGLQEHAWGAVLSAEAQVFTTHPANASLNPSARPNAWAGERLLPRVRQHRDALLVLSRMPSDDPLGRTHAWFPTPCFDEHRFVGEWAAARVGDGYVALWTPGGSRLRRTGQDALQELLPLGPGTAWVCQVSDAAGAGSFDAFCAGLGRPEATASDLGDRVTHRSSGGHLLELSWSGPFLVDGRPVVEPPPDPWEVRDLGRH